MKKKFRRIKWKQVLLYVLISALTLAAFAGIGSLFNRDTKTISSGVFSVGALDQNGRYMESDLSIFTEGLIECKGLCIEPDFKNVSGSFQVFYYGEDKAFIGATEVLNAADGVYTKGDTFGGAVYCRIMITPEIPTDDEGNQVEDYKIRFWNVRSIANDYTITVDKDQTADEVADLFVAKASNNGKMYFWEEADQMCLITSGTGWSCTEIDVSDLESVTIHFKGTAYTTQYFFMTADGNSINYGEVSETGAEIVIPAGTAVLRINYKIGQEFQIIASK